MNAGSFPEKMDALDLIITALKDHEKRLDELYQRLEDIAKNIENKISGKRGEQKQEQKVVRSTPIIIYNKWEDFKRRCKGASTVTFDISDNMFNIYALVDVEVIKYSENLPNKRLNIVEEQSSFLVDKASLSDIDLFHLLLDKRLKCGLTLNVKASRVVLPENRYLFELDFSFGSDEVKSFISRELEIPKQNVVEGKITY